MNNDLISREALKEEFPKLWNYDADYSIFKQIETLIDNATTVEAYTPEQVKELVDLNKKLLEEKPQGEWIRKGNETIFWYECDKCGCEPYYSHSIRTINFCPNCGADMRGK